MDAIKFWLAKELVGLGLFVGALLLLFAFVIVKSAWSRRRGRNEEAPYDCYEADRAQQEVLRRVWETGVPHVANQQRDGSWKIDRVG